MRFQAAQVKQRAKRDGEEKNKRSKTVDLFERDVKVAKVVRQSGFSRRRADRIKYALMNDKAMLQQLLNPSINRAGRRSVIRAEETELVKDRIP